MTDGGKQTTGS